MPPIVKKNPNISSVKKTVTVLSKHTITLPASQRTWKEITVNILHNKEKNLAGIKCKVIGGVGMYVYKLEDNRTLYGLVHIHSGKCIVSFEHEEDAEKMVYYLIDNYEPIFDLKALQAVIQPLQDTWFKPWITAMNEEWQWIDPIEFQEELKAERNNKPKPRAIVFGEELT